MHTRKVLRLCMSAMVFLMLASTLGTAQVTNRDNGQYQILQARYGTDRRNVDVTSELKDLARRQRTFRMDNATFGVDPDIGTVKVLRIYAQDRNGNDRMFEYMEGSTIDGAMFSGWSSGNWGRSGYNPGWGGNSSATANGQGQYEILQARYGTDRRNVDVTSRLKEIARRGRTFRMDNSTFGVDPDIGVVKALRIYARDRQGRDRMFEYTEGSTVDGSMFIGWGSGNMGRTGYNARWGDGARASSSLNIIGASYGAGRQRRDVTDRVRSMIRNGRLNFEVNNNTLGGDPAPNVAKQLRITYATSDGRQQEVLANEGEQLSVP